LTFGRTCFRSANENLFSLLSLIRSLQQLPTFVIFQYLHLVNGNLIEFDKALTLWYTIVDEDRIEVLHVRKADELVDGGIITNVAFEVWIGFTPLRIQLPITPLGSVTFFCLAMSVRLM